MKSLPKASELPGLSGPWMMQFPSCVKVWSKLADYQQRAVRFVLQRKTAALFFEQGTGKTWIAAGLLECMGSSQSSLVVVPKNNKETSWLDLMRNMLTDLVTHTSWEEFKAAKYTGILLLHYEMVPKIITRLARRQWTCVVYDETQRLKDRGSKASRCARRLKAEYKLALTGTPADGDPADIWAQMRFVQPECFGDKWEKFSKRYLKPTGFMGYKKVFIEARRSEFVRKLARWAVREDIGVLNLPELHTHEVWVDMTPKQQRAYHDMRFRKTLRLTREVTLTAPLVITRDMYLSQIAGGFIQHETGVYPVSYRKISAVKRILRRNEGPTVVFCRFVPEVLMLERKLMGKYRVATYYGKTKNKPDVQRRFQAGELDVLICQIRSGGVGLDLFRARAAILYSANWSSIDFDQLKRRVHRRGQTFEVSFFLVMARKTIDVKLHQRILAKSNDNNRTTDQIKELNNGKVHRQRYRRTS